MLIALFSIVANADGIFDKPFAICTSIKSLAAYKLAKSVMNRCEDYDVDIDFKKARKGFESMLTEKDFSPRECNVNCAILNALEKKDMSTCVENVLVDPFVDTFMKEIPFDSTICKDMKRKLGA